jgi:hypothetical protein
VRALQQLVALSVSDQRQRVAPAGPGSRRPINPAGPGPAAPPGGARILTQPIPGGWADPARGPRATLWPGRRSNGTPHRLDQSFGGSESDGRAPGRRGGKAWVARRDHLPRPQSTPRWTLFPNGMKFGPTCVQLFGSRMGQTLHRLDQSSGSCPESDWAGDQALGHPMRPLRSPPNQSDQSHAGRLSQKGVKFCANPSPNAQRKFILNHTFSVTQIHFFWRKYK